MQHAAGVCNLHMAIIFANISSSWWLTLVLFVKAGAYSVVTLACLWLEGLVHGYEHVHDG